MKFVTIEEEYEKTNFKREDVLYLMEWTNMQPHLPKITELEALFFLNCYHGSLEASKTLIENYYTLRTHLPEYFKNRIPKALEKHMDVTLYHHLETKSAKKVLYGCFIDSNADKFDFTEQVKLLGMAFDLWFNSVGTCDTYEFIIDMKGVTMGHVAKLNIMGFKKSIHILQEGLPVQIKYIHVINVIPLADKIMALARPFLRSDLLNKILFHNDLTNLYKYIPQADLFEHLGGNGPTLTEAQEQMKKNLLENEEYFKEEELKRIDESKRVGKPKDSGELFGIEGSFKKLDID